MNLYRIIPKIDKILDNEIIKGLISRYGKFIIKKFINLEINKFKNLIESGEIKEYIEESAVLESIVKAVASSVKSYFSPRLKKLINATGVVLHTNFGRAPLSEKVLKNVVDIAGNYSNLEFDIAMGERGIRYQNISDYLTELTGAEDCMVVNNNAAAVLLLLSALAKGKEVIVSRGEMIEIGGEFRIPEVMEQSGAILKEVGSTNKTHLKDYFNAINETTALILKAHTSNYRIVGFTKSVEAEELVSLGDKSGLPVAYDLGSGSFVDLSSFGLPDEPTVKSIIDKGVDIVTFSGDKLLGGPQAGIIVGKKKYIDTMKRHPLNRALRIDKFTLAALEATLVEYFNDKDLFKNILSLSLITEDIFNLKKRALRLKRLFAPIKSIYAEVKEDVSFVGGGAFPMNQIKTFTLQIKHQNLSAANIDKILRSSDPPVVGRVKNDVYILDVRTLLNDQITELKNVFYKNFN